ncbi:MAG: manganese-binding transcriptional regulator MntR [bacterium]|nr:manganese-binding transcriptional regulator MntR [bacterium]
MAGKRTNQFSRTRSDHATELAEDYVEAIADICDDAGACRSVDLAKHFRVSNATVNRTVGRLVRDGFAETEPYGPIQLTRKGIALAKASRRRHEVVIAFLKAIGVGDEAARIDSEGIEHHVSDETLAAMKRYLKQNSCDLPGETE